MVRGWITQPCLGELWQRAQHVLLVIRPCFRARPPVSGANLFNPSQGRIIVNITIIVIIIIIRRSGTDSGSPCGVLPKMMPAPPPPPHNTQFQCVVVSAHTHGYRSIAHSPQPQSTTLSPHRCPSVTRQPVNFRGAGGEGDSGNIVLGSSCCLSQQQSSKHGDMNCRQGFKS